MDAIHALDNKNGSSRKEIIKYMRTHFAMKIDRKKYNLFYKAMNLMIAGNTLNSVEQHGAVGNGKRFKSNIIWRKKKYV